jgi:hypothetical protein
MFLTTFVTRAEKAPVWFRAERNGYPMCRRSFNAPHFLRSATYSLQLINIMHKTAIKITKILVEMANLSISICKILK